jgi:hypothetical protein
MPDPETDAGTTEVVEATSESTAETTEATPDAGTTAETSSGSEESFYPDPSQLPPELKEHYKGMQGHFTRRMQSLKSQQDKIAAYDAFSANPQETIRQLASRYGMTLQQAEQAAEEFQPNDWKDVTNHVTQAVLSQLDPIFREVRSVKQNSIEAQLDATMPEWREYETQMGEMLTKHPTLSDDPVALAKMVIPDSVLQSKATQAAMRKLESKGKAAQVTSGSGTSKEANPLKPGKKMSFAESVAWARKKVAAEANK